MMFGRKTTIDCFTASKIAEAMNTWAGPQYRKDIITTDEVMAMKPVKISSDGGHTVYACQWGDVTILVWLRDSGDVIVKNVCW
jgi:hypothetical protein